MISDALKDLLRRVPLSGARWISFALSSLIGLAVPLLAFIFGHSVQALSGQPITAILPNITLPDFGLGDASPMARVVWMLGAAAVVTFFASLLLFWTYRFVQQAAVEFEVGVLKIYRQRVQQLSQFKTLSAQQNALVDNLQYHLPLVRGALARYWQSIPRHGVQLAICVLVGILIHAQFSFLAIIASALAVLCYQWLDRLHRLRLPIVRDNAAQLRNRLVNLCLRGPLLGAVHDSQEIDQRFGHSLELYQGDAVRSLTNSSWKTPALVSGISMMILLLVFVMSIQGLRSQLELPAAATFLFCLVASVYSARRLIQARRELRKVDSACKELVGFLSIQIPEIDETRLSGIHRVAQQAELQFVTVQDSQGRKLIEDISETFETGHLIGVFSSQPLEARALAELLVGLGRPTSGRLLFDGRSVIDLKSNDLLRCAHWVSSDGGILTGSLAENLSSHVEPSARQAIQQAELGDLTNRLADGLYTLITHDDDRLLPDEAFRIGLARALLRSTSIVVIEEPVEAVSPVVEQKTLDAMLRVVTPGRISVVLPQRLSTLRHCERILFIHEHRLVDSGRHAELVQRNEHYRHLTYLKFNPFR